MKNRKFTYAAKWILMLLCVASALVCGAQVNIKITVLPPYPSHFTDYASRPQQIMIMITNTGNTALNIQLRGSINGDNGVSIRVSQQYKAASPIHLNPLETKNLSGSDINALFDYNQLVYSGITRDQLVTQGNLPEGNYEICARAYDYATNAPLSEDQPSGCSNIFPVSSVEPPTIIKPFDGESLSTLGGQNFVITWSTPAGSPPSTQYTVEMVEILDNRSPENAIMTATSPMFFQSTVMGSSVLLYGPAQPTLTVGRRYALMVVAKDPTNTVTFRNNGQSEIIGFTYGDNTIATPPDENQVTCSCTTPLPGDVQPANNHIGVGGIIKAGNFNVTVLSLTKNNDNTISGTGKVNLPVANSSFIPVGVNFANISVNSSNQLIQGAIFAQVKNGVNFLPTTQDPNPSLVPFGPSDVTNLASYIENNTSNVVSQILNAGANTVFQLPLGIDKQIMGSPVTIEITALKINATQAVMDAATIINTPDDNVVSRIALGARNVCVNPTDLCGDAKLFLAEDVTLPTLNLTLKGAANPGGGTYIVFDKTGFKNLQIVGAITFPTSLIVKKWDKASQVTATITANTQNGWSDWMAQVSIDPFSITGNNDFGFTLVGSATYDHSDVQNPAGLPTITEKPELATPQWHGFFMPQLTIDLPAALKNGDGTNITTAVQNLIIDNNGVSGSLTANNILQIGNGSLGGWYYSIDDINLSIVNNGFKNGGMDGKLVLPVSDMSHQNAELDYHSTLSESTNNSGVQFQFVIAPKSNLDFALWVATAQIDQTSNITVSAGAGSDFSAVATLNGHLSITAQLPVVGAVNFAQVKFEQLKLETSAPYLDFGNSSFSLASPQHSIGGHLEANDATPDKPVVDDGSMDDFPVTINNISPYFSSGDVGLKFTMNLQLSDIAALPDASTTLSIYGKFKMDNGRPKFYFDPGDAVQLDQITVKGSLGALTIDGVVDFYYNDATYGNGFKGSVKATFPAIDIGVASTVQFGSVGGYKYWYVDAMIDLGQAGIVLGNTGMSIFGFGGGAYYHMKQSVTLPGASSISTKTPDANAAPGASVTGISYKPDVNTALGLKATILFGVNARPVFNADATLGIEFAGSGGISDMNFVGNGRMLDVPPKPAVTMTVQANYDFANNIFMASLSANMDYPPLNSPLDLQGHGTIQVYFGPGPKPFGNYYIKFGLPEPENARITFPYEFLNNNQFYMEAGNYQIDPMPPLPADIITVLQKSGVNTSIFSRANDPDISSGAGFIFGASAGFKYQGQFAIFKADFGATIGFDIALKQYGQDANISCSNGQTTIGYGGWYATGQIYAGIWGSIDISTDFFGDINILDVGAGAALQAGLPNPTYVTGAIGGYYSVLDGAISGSLHYEFTMGEPCTISKDVLSGFKLISDVNPVDGSTDMEVTTAPAVAFNFNLTDNDNVSFSIMQHIDGKPDTRRDFRFNQNCVNATLHDNTNNADIAVTASESSDRTGMTFVPNETLAKSSQHVLNVTARLDELVAGVWQPALYSTGANAGKPFQDTRAITFTTNKGLDSIPESMVEYTYPLKWQRFFMPDEASTTAFGTGNAIIKLDQVINPASLDMNGPDQGYTQSFYAKIVPNGGIATTIPFSLTADQSGKINFELPPGLNPNTVYAIQFIGRADPKGSLNFNLANSQVTSLINNTAKFTQLQATGNSTGFTVENKLAVYQSIAGNNSFSNDTIRARALNNQLALKSDEKQLYIIYFKTSQYKQFSDKQTDMPITNVEFALTGANTDSYIMPVSEMPVQKSSNKSLRAYIANKLGIIDTSAANPAYSSFNVTYVRSVYFNSNEYFDDYDILGYNKSSDVTGHTYSYSITPLISVTNKTTTGWIDAVMNSILQDNNLQAAYNQGPLFDNPLIGSRSFSDTISNIDAKDVGNIDMTVVNGGETTQYYFSLLPHFGGGGGFSSAVFLNSTLSNYALKATYTEGWQSSSGTGAGGGGGIGSILNQYLYIYGGDPGPSELQNIGSVYSVINNANTLNSSITGGTIQASYQLPGTGSLHSSFGQLQFGGGGGFGAVGQMGAFH